MPHRPYLDILICDDHPLSIDGIDAILLRAPAVKNYRLQLRRAYSAYDLQIKLKEKQPDLLFLDLSLPDCEPIEHIQNLLAVYPNLHIFVITAASNALLLSQIQQLPLRGVMSKLSTSEKIHEALSSFLGSTKVKYIDTKVEALIKSAPPSQPLSSQEYKVLTLLSQGKDRNEIAETMKCHKSTIRSYIDRISAKTGAANIADFVSLYLQGQIQKENSPAKP